MAISVEHNATTTTDSVTMTESIVDDRNEFSITSEPNAPDDTESVDAN